MPLKKILLFSILLFKMLSPLSVVYNFRIAQITKQPIVKQEDKKPHSLTGLLFNFFQKTQNDTIKENYSGGLTTFNYNITNSGYFRTDIAIAHINQKINAIQTVDITEPDDILFTFGKNFISSQKSKITLSGLIGIPTHSVYTLQRVPFGSGQIGTGIQLDGLYKIIPSIDFLWGARYNHFFPKTAFDNFDHSYQFSIGNIADILIALQSSNLLSHGIEGGYNLRCGFGAKSSPSLSNLSLLNYKRNNFYIVYKYTFLGQQTAHRFLLNITYGFDSKPLLYGYNAWMIWAAWSLAF
ncbi:hypothetical protein HYV11_02505 [Candidatus Dependentiae bacterium]|nr:hypothetical protein [Candidatus Dependentiae bacterium]